MSKLLSLILRVQNKWVRAREDRSSSFRIGSITHNCTLTFEHNVTVVKRLKQVLPLQFSNNQKIFLQRDTYNTLKTKPESTLPKLH